MKIWANSGDSHYLEPEDLYSSGLPKALAESPGGNRARLGPAFGAQSPRSPPITCVLLKLARFVLPPSIET